MKTKRADTVDEARARVTLAELTAQIAKVRATLRPVADIVPDPDQDGSILTVCCPWCGSTDLKYSETATIDRVVIDIDEYAVLGIASLLLHVRRREHRPGPSAD